MAYVAKTAFEARITNNEFNELCNIAGKFVDGSGDPDVCSAGTLVKRNQQLPCEGYTGVYNENAWEMVVAETTDNASESIYASNTYDVNMVTDSFTGGIYAIGANTLGLPIPAGRMGTFTKIVFDGDHVYRFGEGNVDGTVGTDTYFLIDDGFLSPSTYAPSDNGAIYFELRGTGSFTVGATAGDTHYDVVAKTAFVAESK